MYKEALFGFGKKKQKHEGTVLDELSKRITGEDYYTHLAANQYLWRFGKDIKHPYLDWLNSSNKKFDKAKSIDEVKQLCDEGLTGAIQNFPGITLINVLELVPKINHFLDSLG